MVYARSFIVMGIVMGSKKRIVKWIILGVLGVILAVIATVISVNEIYAHKIPHRFASAREGRELLLSNTEYYENYSQNDIDCRMKKSGATIDELLEASADEVKGFNIFEKYFIDARIAGMVRKLEKNGYQLPEIDEITFVNTKMAVEFGASGYTHGTEIYLNSSLVAIYSALSFIPEFAGSADELICHELFHCLTRCNPEFRKQAYSLINFTVTDTEFDFPPSVRDLILSNPDVEHHDSYATFIIDGQEIDCFVAFASDTLYADNPGCEQITVLIPIDGTDIYYTQEQASNFDEVFGTNTSYVIDPEECLADNFKFAMLYGTEGKDKQGYPNPEIIEGIIDIVKE